MSTYQDGATLGAVLGQGCSRDYGEKGMHSPCRGEGEGNILTNEEFILPPYSMGYVWGKGAHCRGEGGTGVLLQL